MTGQVQYRNAQRNDLQAIAQIFLTAFPESVQHYVGHEIPSDVLVDAFGICLDAEPTAFVVALVDNQIAG
ncbi:MAG TPA: hypothetical protein VHV83_01345, partial [Armatimonadota bacterium]|nr:hypothetical protein [Armatimonadota bacterium]